MLLLAAGHGRGRPLAADPARSSTSPWLQAALAGWRHRPRRSGPHPRGAFQQALLPLHAGGGGQAGARRRQANAQARIAARVGAPAWRIEILRPDAQAFRDHARPGLRTDAPAGLPAIDNAYQALQYARRPDLPDSRSIFLANTLRLRLTYLYRPLLPPLRALLAGLAGADGSYANAARASGLAPIGMELDMEMHSHPVDWRGGQPYPPGMVAGACRGLHCP